MTVQQLCPTHSSLPSRLGREYILLLAACVAHITHFIWVWRLKRVKRVGGSVVGWRGPSAFSAVGSRRWLMETR